MPVSSNPIRGGLNPAERYLVHLVSCAFSGATARDLPDNCTWRSIFDLACQNSIPGLLYSSVKHVSSIPDDVASAWAASANMTMLRAVQFEAERAVVCESLARAGFGYVVIKGPVVAGAYDAMEQRSMADNDILYGIIEADPSSGEYRVAGMTERDRRYTIERSQATVQKIMGELGYTVVEQLPDACDIHFAKPPFLSFELHHALMEIDSPFYSYYANPWRRARKTGAAPGVASGEFHFSLEDHYVYLVTHAAKHFRRSGAGIRILADVIAYRRAYTHELDMEYVHRELAVLGLLDFECELWNLACEVVADGPFDEDAERALHYMIACGTYGTEDEQFRLRLLRKSDEAKSGNMLFSEIRRFFSPEEACPRSLRPFAQRGLLRPLFPFARMVMFLSKAIAHPHEQLRKIRYLLFGQGER